MRTVILYVGISLDGCMADPDGNVDWMCGQDDDAAPADTYSEFIRNVDTVVMGWNTYHQITTALSPDQWPYPAQTTYVVTHRQADSTEAIRFTAESPCALVRRLQRQNGRNIWICGGASIAQQLMEADLIDRFQISILPTILGDGVRLFGRLTPERKLRLLQTRTHNGIVELCYERRYRNQRTEIPNHLSS